MRCCCPAGGEARLDYFKKVATAPALSRIGAKLDFSGFRNGNVWIALFTFLCALLTGCCTCVA